MNSLLHTERSGATFDAKRLEQVITKSSATIVRKFAHLFDEPVFNNQDEDILVSYEEKFRRSIERVSRSFEIVRNNPDFMIAHMRQKVQMETFFDHNGIFLHFSMFLNYLKSQANDAQLKYWNAQARQGNFIGAYAQTELGHGSNVRGLETTATLDLANSEYEIHSPTLTSLKFWPTGMFASTHAMVFAQLLINGQNHGLHGFMVQLRQSDGTTMPGVELGEIGPKLNFTSNNIGYARFTRVRIPVDRLFSKYSHVTANGDYVAAPRSLSKFRYISMMLARTSIVRVAFKMAAKASTIAIRYSAVRKQGFTPQSSAENIDEYVVLDYKMQQYRLYKGLSFSYCLLWNARYIHSYIKGIQGRLEDGDTSAADDLPELHATLSGLKAVATVTAHENIEEARKCCGGQGFLLSSGIAKLAPDFSEWVTVEGEQVILSLQCARFLLKACHASKNGVTLTETVRYIGEQQNDSIQADVHDPNGILRLLKMRARNLAWRFTAQFDEHEKEVGFDAALNQSAVIAVLASTAHVQAFMYENNSKAIKAFFTDEIDIQMVMTRLLMLHGLQLISENAGDFIGCSTMTASVIADVERAVGRLMEEIRPDAVALVDSFGFVDAELKSTLGRFDGYVYKAIMSEARKNPLNKSKKMVGWEAFSSVLNLEFLDKTAESQHQREEPAGNNVSRV
jgi:acyl-CoA oxidase